MPSLIRKYKHPLFKMWMASLWGLLLIAGPDRVRAQGLCINENNSYRQSAVDCENLQKTSDAANVSSSLASTTVNPLVVGGAFVAAVTVAKVAEHNCQISENKEKVLSKCIEKSQRNQKEKLQALIVQYSQLEKQKSLMDLWESGNVQHELRLVDLIRKVESNDTSRLLLAKDSQTTSLLAITDEYLKIRTDHRGLLKKVKLTEKQNGLNTNITSDWQE